MIKHRADGRTLDLTWTTNDSDFGFPNGNTYSKNRSKYKAGCVILRAAQICESVKRKLKTRTAKWQHSHKLAACAWGWLYDRLPVSTLTEMLGFCFEMCGRTVYFFKILLLDQTNYETSQRWQTSSHIIFICLYSLTLKFHFGSCHWVRAVKRMENSTRHRTDSVCLSSASCLASGQVMSQVRSLTVEPLCRDFMSSWYHGVSEHAVKTSTSSGAIHRQQREKEKRRLFSVTSIRSATFPPFSFV